MLDNREVRAKQNELTSSLPHPYAKLKLGMLSPGGLSSPAHTTLPKPPDKLRVVGLTLVGGVGLAQPGLGQSPANVPGESGGPWWVRPGAGGPEPVVRQGLQTFNTQLQSE